MSSKKSLHVSYKITTLPFSQNLKFKVIDNLSLAVELLTIIAGIMYRASIKGFYM